MPSIPQTVKPAKPFLKWAGGKTQLLDEIAALFPSTMKLRPFTYVEPFVGSGAVLFWVLAHYPHLKKVVINDVNADLVNTYRVIQEDPQLLIETLSQWQAEYHDLDENTEAKKQYYYAKRSQFNQRTETPAMQAALLIFLNRTCFNGLYRVNRRNAFNVPMGNYKRPLICHAENLQAVHLALQKAHIMEGDYQQTLAHAETPALFYFDPPYRPLNATSSFNTYSAQPFDDGAQTRLGMFCRKIDGLGHDWILSNSDPQSVDPKDRFFSDLYQGFTIHTVEARRNINALGSKRGMVKELLITNNKKL